MSSLFQLSEMTLVSYDTLNFVVDSLLSNFSALNDFDQRTMAPSEFGIPFFYLVV